jgi:TRAP-type C4-dicarboxylate transport system permease small subunit
VSVAGSVPGGEDIQLQHTPPSAGPVERIGDALVLNCCRVAAVALSIIVLINGANVVGRYFFGRPIGWAEEAMLYLMIFVVFAGAIGATWRGVHIGIDAFVTRMPPAFQRAAGVAMSLLSIVLLLTVAKAGFDTVQLLYAFDQRSDAMEFPMWIPQSFVVIGFGVSAILIAVRIFIPAKRGPSH